MRIISAAVILPCLVGCTVQPPAPYAHVELPYSACEPMADLRNNLTGTPYPSAKSDAVLHSLGVAALASPIQPWSAPTIERRASEGRGDRARAPQHRRPP